MRIWVSQFLTETTFQLQISRIQYYYGYLRVPLLIFLIAHRLFQSTLLGLHFLLNNNHNSNWAWLVELSTKKVSHEFTGWGFSCEGGGGAEVADIIFQGVGNMSGKCKSDSWHKKKNLLFFNLQTLAALPIHS